MAARMRYVEQCWFPTAGRDGDLCTSRERCSGRGRHSELHTGIAVCRACAPILLAHHSIYHLQKECRHPFREPLQFIVIVMMSVIEETPYLSGLLAGVTVMTLMTVLYGLILKIVPS